MKPVILSYVMNQYNNVSVMIAKPLFKGGTEFGALEGKPHGDVSILSF